MEELYKAVYESGRAIPTKASNNKRARLPELVEGPLTRDEAIDIRDMFICALLERYESLSINYRIEGTNNRNSENIILIITLLDVYIAMTLEAATRAQLETFRATDFAYLRDSDLANSSSCALQYTMSELMRAMYQLCARWNTIRFSEQLVGYVDVLRVRIGQFMHWTHSGWIHDVSKLRVLVQNSDEDLPENLADAEYQCSPEARELFTCMLNAILTRLSYTKLGEWVELEEQQEAFIDLSDYGIDLSSPEWRGATIITGLENTTKGIVFNDVKRKSGGLLEDDTVSAEQCNNFKRWIRYRLDAMMCDSASQVLRRDFLKMSLRPGERENFKVRCPDGVPTEHNVLKKFRGAEFLLLWAQQDRNIPDVIDAEIDMHPEPLSLVLVLVDLLEQYVSSEFFPLTWTKYVIFEHELGVRSTDPITHGDMPCIVQLGGHFQVYHKGRILRFDSLVRSVLALLHIVKTTLGGKIGAIPISAWFKEMNDVRSGKLRPKRKQTKKKDNEVLDNPTTDLFDDSIDRALRAAADEADDDDRPKNAGAQKDSDEVMSVL